MARVVVTADDFGYDSASVASTIHLLDQGIVTCASIMVNMPATDSALANAVAASRGGVDFGVHLNFLTDDIERPLARPAEIPTLVSKSLFHGSNETRLRALAGRIDERDVEREACLQIDRVVSEGIPVCYIDSHGHLHKFRPFFVGISSAMRRFRITRMRTAQNVYLAPRPTSPTFWLSGYWGRRIQARHTSTRYHFMPTSGVESAWSDRLTERLTQFGDATIEVGVHPAAAGSETWKVEEAREVQRFSLGLDTRHSIIHWRDVS